MSTDIAEVAVFVVSLWSSVSIEVNWTHALVFCVLMLCSRVTTLYQVDFVSSDNGVEAMFSQTVVHSAYAYLIRIRINGLSCAVVADGIKFYSAGPFSGGKISKGL